MEDLCIECGLIVDRKNLGRHLKTHNGDKIKCFSCDKTFSRMDHLKRHEKIHGENPNFHCYLCDKSFKNKDSLRKHVKVIHQHMKFSCTLCPKTFTSKENMAAHQIKCKPKVYTKCTLCLKTFEDKLLNKHLKSHDENHKCDKCDKISF